MLKAKPCPFCRGSNIRFLAEINAVCCDNSACMMQGPDVNDAEIEAWIESVAWQKWNDRADDEHAAACSPEN